MSQSIGMQSHYNVNVARKENSSWHEGTRYAHYFDVDIVDVRKAKEVFEDLKARYPEPEYKVEAVHWSIIGREVTLSL